MRSRDGFSLLEVMVASTILVIGVIPLLALTQRNTQGVSTSLDKVEAVTVATALLEALQSVPFEYLHPTDSPEPVPVSSLHPETRGAVRLPRVGDRFQLLVQIRADFIEEPPGLSEVHPARRAELLALTQLRAIDVVCRYRTRAMTQRLGETRDAEVRLGTLVARAAAAR